MTQKGPANQLVQRIVILGLGAQAKYAIETFSHDPKCQVVGLVDLAERAAAGPVWGLPVLGGAAVLDKAMFANADAAFVGCADSQQKKAVFESLRRLGVPIVSAIHPRACVARTAELGEGVMINAGAVIQPFARIGDGAMIHANCVVEHDCEVGMFANLAPGSTLAGWVRVGAHARVFTGASVIPKIEIGTGATVAAGAVVIENVPAHGLVAGVPARPIEKAAST